MQYRNPTTGLPLVYVIREHDDITEEILDADYPTIDDDLIATTELDGAQYELDCQHIWGLLEPLLRKGVGWNFAKVHKTLRQGRLGYLAVKTQETGTAAHQSRKDSAYAAIAAAKYTGRGRFTFSQYVDMYMKNSNTVAELGEPIPDTKLCNDFLDGIHDPILVETVRHYQGNVNLRAFWPL